MRVLTLMYLLYDKHTGPQLSEEQPNETDLKLMGPVKVKRGGLEKSFEVYAEKGSKRAWAKLIDWKPCVDTMPVSAQCSIGG